MKRFMYLSDIKVMWCTYSCKAPPPTHTQDHMWGHRQEERELKRAEMEVGKQKKQLQRVMKNYESSE